MRAKLFAILAGVALVTLGLPLGVANADHSWSSYHWARSQNPLTLGLGDNVTNNWDSYLATASSDWSKSTVIDTNVVAGQASGRKCTPDTGRAEVCNGAYGNNGWLGIAQIWASGNHITQGSVRLNDSYFNTATYNTPAWRNLVMCQEVGHIFGLDHQDENFDNPNLGTCMDYTSDPSSNQHPNAHDYQQLESIYAHLDAAAAPGPGNGNGHGHGNGGVADQPGWGRAVSDSAAAGEKPHMYVKNLGDGKRVFTFVYWVH